MDDDINLSSLELIVMSLTIFIIFSIILQNVLDINPEMLKLLNIFDFLCSFVFLFEWFYRFAHAKDKISFVCKNCIDLVASLPMSVFSGLKALRLVKLFQVLKIIGSVNRFKTYYKNNLIQLAKLSMFIIFFLLTMISPVMILYFEYDSGPINTAENALWWTYVTITTIGYGDLYPTTSGGRLFTVFVSLGGIGLFGIISSLIVNYIVTINNEKIQD